MHSFVPFDALYRYAFPIISCLQQLNTWGNTLLANAGQSADDILSRILTGIDQQGVAPYVEVQQTWCDCKGLAAQGIKEYEQSVTVKSL